MPREPSVPLHRRERSAGPLLGMWVKIPAIEVVEVLALSGVDFVVVDMEHAPIDVSQASTLIAVGRALGLPVLVRVPSRDETWLKRVLDAGADGVVVPHIDTVEQAREVVRGCRFPPMGIRGVGVTGRLGDWGLSDPSAYFATADAAISVLVQLESAEALGTAAAIGAVDGIDGVFIGPADLAASLQEEPGGPRAAALIDNAERECVRSGTLLATASSVAAAGALVPRGYKLLVIGNDAQFLGTAARSALADLRTRGPAGDGECAVSVG